MKPLQVYEIKFGNSLPSLFFLIDQETATALPLEKEEDLLRRRSHWLYFRLDESQTCYGMPLASAAEYQGHFVHLLLEEISRQVQFKVTRFIYNHPAGRASFGERFDEYLHAHKAEVVH